MSKTPDYVRRLWWDDFKYLLWRELRYYAARSRARDREIEATALPAAPRRRW